MLGKKKSTKQVAAGVDIGAYSIKILETAAEKETNKLTKFAIKEIPPGTTSDKLPGALKDALESAGLSTKNIRISLAGPDAIVRIINMPEMSLQDLKSSLKFEADRYIPFSVDEVNIDCCILGKAKEGTNQIRVLLAAVKKDLINRRIKMFQDIGYAVSLVDVNVFAVLNAFMKSEKDIKPDSSIAILNIGHRYTNIVTCKGDSPYFTRDIPIGGEHIAGIVARKTSIEPKDVFIGGPAVQEKQPEIQEAFRLALAKLGDEIRMSFGYYENQFGSAVEKVYISGGLANVEHVPAFLEEVLGMKPVIWNPIGAFEIGDGVDKAMLESSKSWLAIVAGLVLRTDI